MVKYCIPASLDEALAVLKTGEYIPYAGGTDINSRNVTGKGLLFIGKLPALMEIRAENGNIHLGAAVTYSQAERSPLVPQIMKTAIRKVAGPAIRNLGTFGGNLANASGKADSALVNLTLDAKLRIRSADSERYVAVSDFYLSKGVTCLKPDELITEIVIPDSPWFINYYYDKISVRTAVAISNLSIASVWEIRDGILAHLAIGVGSATDYPVRCTDIEQAFTGLRLEEISERYDSLLAGYVGGIEMSSDRTSVFYRRRVCFNLLEYLIREEFTPIEL